MSTKGWMFLKNLQMTKRANTNTKIIIINNNNNKLKKWKFKVLENLQMTKKQTHEERKQTLEPQHSWKTYKQLENKPKKKEIEH